MLNQSLLLKLLLLGASLIVIDTTRAQASSSWSAISAEIELLAANDLAIVEQESSNQLKNPLSSERTKSCKRIDLKQYKKKYAYYTTDFEHAIAHCNKNLSMVAWQLWRSLDVAKKTGEKAAYQAALDFIRSSEYQEADADSPYRTWTDSVVADYESGLGDAETVRKAYAMCSGFAHKDADLVMLRESPSSSGDLDRELDRGQAICD